MATTKELFKERMTIRKTDPLRAGVLGMIIDSVQKAIRELDRDETPEDIQKAAKKMYDQTFATIQEYKKGNADTTQLENELAILKEFVPESLSPEKIKSEIESILASLDESERNLKNIMPRLKEISGMDMKIAKDIVQNLL